MTAYSAGSIGARDDSEWEDVSDGGKSEYIEQPAPAPAAGVARKLPVTAARPHPTNGSPPREDHATDAQRPTDPSVIVRLRVRAVGDGHSDRPVGPAPQYRRRLAATPAPRRMDAEPRPAADGGQLLLYPGRHAVRGLRVGQRGALRLGLPARRAGRRGGAGRAAAGADVRAGGALPPPAGRRAAARLSHRHGGGAARRLALGGPAAPRHAAARGPAARAGRAGGSPLPLVVPAASSVSGPTSTAGSPTG